MNVKSLSLAEAARSSPCEESSITLVDISLSVGYRLRKKLSTGFWIFGFLDFWIFGCLACRRRGW
jgi:hypothetical protein